jgi:CheY-like chemotaxis protein
MPDTTHSLRTTHRLAVMPTVLVVDADDDTRVRYRQTFMLEDWEVLEASDGREALATAFVDKPTLVVAATWLPFIDGCALANILRHDPSTAETLIVLLTADALPASIDRARRSGADVVLPKPTGMEDMLTAIRRLFSAAGDHIDAIAWALDGGTGRRVASRAIRQAPKGRRSRARSFVRFTTTTPSASPPSLTCPLCDRRLTYERSHVGGVIARYPEQWDYYRCPVSCGTFQYRHRTRITRLVESGPLSTSG